MERVECAPLSSGEPCRCPQCSFFRAETVITKSVAALVYAPAALLMVYVVRPLDEVASFALLLTAIFGVFYAAISQQDLRQRRGGA